MPTIAQMDQGEVPLGEDFPIYGMAIGAGAYWLIAAADDNGLLFVFANLGADEFAEWGHERLQHLVQGYGADVFIFPHPMTKAKAEWMARALANAEVVIRME